MRKEGLRIELCCQINLAEGYAWVSSTGQPVADELIQLANPHIRRVFEAGENETFRVNRGETDIYGVVVEHRGAVDDLGRQGLMCSVICEWPSPSANPPTDTLFRVAKHINVIRDLLVAEHVPKAAAVAIIASVLNLLSVFISKETGLRAAEPNRSQVRRASERRPATINRTLRVLLLVQIASLTVLAGILARTYSVPLL